MRGKSRFPGVVISLLVCLCLFGCGNDATEAPKQSHPTGIVEQVTGTMPEENSSPIADTVLPEQTNPTETEQSELATGEESKAPKQPNATEVVTTQPVKPSEKDDMNETISKPTVPKKPNAATEDAGNESQTSGNLTVQPTQPEEETHVTKPTVQENILPEAEEELTDDEDSTSQTTVPTEIPVETEPATEESSKDTDHGIELPDDDWG